MVRLSGMVCHVAVSHSGLTWHAEAQCARVVAEGRSGLVRDVAGVRLGPSWVVAPMGIEQTSRVGHARVRLSQRVA